MSSSEHGTTVKSQTEHNVPVKQKKVEEESSSDGSVVARDKTKRKGDTDHRNSAFTSYLKERQGKSQDYNMTHKRFVKSQCSGRVLRPRIDLPDGVEVFPYSQSRLNVWEF